MLICINKNCLFYNVNRDDCCDKSMERMGCCDNALIIEKSDKDVICINKDCIYNRDKYETHCSNSSGILSCDNFKSGYKNNINTIGMKNDTGKICTDSTCSFYTINLDGCCSYTGGIDSCSDAIIFKPSDEKTIGMKNDTGKNRWDLVPWKQFDQVVDIITFGAKKYSDENWKKVINAKQRYFSAAMRHLVAWFTGEKNDQESGKSHLAHAICCLLFLMWFDDNSEKKIDD